MLCIDLKCIKMRGLLLFRKFKMIVPASRRAVTRFASGAGSLRFKSLAGQIENSVDKACHSCGISSKGIALPAGAITR